MLQIRIKENMKGNNNHTKQTLQFIKIYTITSKKTQ